MKREMADNITVKKNRVLNEFDEPRLRRLIVETVIFILIIAMMAIISMGQYN